MLGQVESVTAAHLLSMIVAPTISNMTELQLQNDTSLQPHRTLMPIQLLWLLCLVGKVKSGIHLFSDKNRDGVLFLDGNIPSQSPNGTVHFGKTNTLIRSHNVFCSFGRQVATRCPPHSVLVCRWTLHLPCRAEYTWNHWTIWNECHRMASVVCIITFLFKELVTQCQCLPDTSAQSTWTHAHGLVAFVAY